MTQKLLEQLTATVKTTMERNTKELNHNLKQFIYDTNLRPTYFEAQVPTCLVLTSSESASSIETQFRSLCQDMEKSVSSKNVVLDEKKCGNIKSAIEHLLSRLRMCFPEDGKDDEGESGDELDIRVL